MHRPVPRWWQVSRDQPADRPEDRGHYGLRESQLLLMHATDQLILDHTNRLAETLQFIVTQTQKILDARYVDILFLYPDGFRNEISTDDADIGRFVPFDYSIAGFVLSCRAPVIVNDVRSDPTLRERYIPRPSEDPGSESPRSNIIAVELTLDGEEIGVLNIESTSDGGFNESHLGFAIAVASQISTAIRACRALRRGQLAAHHWQPAGMLELEPTMTRSCAKSSSTVPEHAEFAYLSAARRG